MNNENRLGKFTLSDREVQRWTHILPIMGNFVIVDARFRFDTRVVEYTAYSPLFEAIPEFTTAPEYILEIAEFPDAPAVIKAHKQG